MVSWQSWGRGSARWAGETKRELRLRLVWGERLISPARFRAYCLIMESIGIGCMNGDTVNKQPSLPDPEICRTRYRGESLDISQCLMENPDSCGHAVRFGSSVFCRHPDRRSFENPRKPI
jgi:hypothetical protein